MIRSRGAFNAPDSQEISRPGRDRRAGAALAAPASRPPVKRWAWLAGGLAVLLGVLAAGAARMAGRQGSRPATLVSVVTGWLGAWVLWGFVGGLAAHYGMASYDGQLFALLAVAGAVWQYRVQTRQGTQQGVAVFLAGQLVWLGVVLWQNGVLLP